MNNNGFNSERINDIQVHYQLSKKYKTNILVVNIAQTLSEDTVTKIALLPYILKRGTKNYPTLKSLQEKLDEMYGALLFVYVFKRGERHIAQFSIEVANEKYLSENVNLLKEAIQLLGEIITNPLMVDGAFKEEYVSLEKEKLQNRIQSIYDDKIRYAGYQTIKNMCKNEPYRLHENGSLDAIGDITSINLYDFYQDWIKSSPIDLFVIGDFEVETLLKEIKESFKFPSRDIDNLHPNLVDIEVVKENIIQEEQPVAQGKLNIGLRTYTDITDDDYIGLLLYNGVLGGFAHSKLFINVREKASLAYYASSRFDSHKGILTIQSGIETQNFEKALEIIKQQLELLRNGEVSEDELNLTKSVLSNQLREIADSPRQFSDFAYHSVLSGKNRTLDEILECVQHGTVEDIVNIAKKVKLDTIYFLKGTAKEGR